MIWRAAQDALLFFLVISDSQMTNDGADVETRFTLRIREFFGEVLDGCEIS